LLLTVAHAVMRQPARSGIRTRLVLVLSLSLVLLGVLPSPASAGWLRSDWPVYEAALNSEAARVLEYAHAQLGRQFVMGGIGPTVFDCSGLVWAAFKNSGLADRMGGKRRGATGYLNWFKKFGTWSPNLSDARPGDILIWGGGKHSGIFITGKWAISALNPRYDIRIHRADRVGLPFTAVLFVPMSRTDGGSVPTPPPTPTPSPSATPAASATPSAQPSSSPSASPSQSAPKHH
jgi:hypothetical protein